MPASSGRTRSTKKNHLGRPHMLKRALCGAALSIACATLAAAQVRDFKPVTDQVLADPDPADWLMLNRTFDQQRYSPLKEMNKGNVGQLRMAWSRGLPPGTQESVPIVYRGVMYLFAPGASIQAVDATTGDLIWEYQRDYPQGVNPRAARNKSLGIYEDMIFFAAPDGFLLALDAATGKLRWETKVDEGGQTAGGILVADGKVITNRTCIADVRAKCFIAAHDAKTGREVWRFYTTAAAGEPGGDTWADMPTELRAASPWGLPGSYDAKRKLLYWGVANPDPYTRLKRHGRYDAVPFTAPVNLYSNSTLALDVAIGKPAASCGRIRSPTTIPTSTWATSTSSTARPASIRTSCSRRTATRSSAATTTRADCGRSPITR